MRRNPFKRSSPSVSNAASADGESGNCARNFSSAFVATENCFCAMASSEIFNTASRCRAAGALLARFSAYTDRASGARSSFTSASACIATPSAIQSSCFASRAIWSRFVVTASAASVSPAASLISAQSSNARLPAQFRFERLGGQQRFQQGSRAGMIFQRELRLRQQQLSARHQFSRPDPVAPRAGTRRWWPPARRRFSAIRRAS